MSNNGTSLPTSVIVLKPSSEHFVTHARVTIAPWLMGTLADLFLQGVLAAQTTTYFTLHEERSLSSLKRPNLSWLVIFVGILCVLKSVQNIVDVWQLLVVNYCNPDTASTVIVTNWIFSTASLSTAVIAIVVQSFFVYRYWMLTKRWYICITIIIGMILSITAACLVVVSLEVPKPSSTGPRPVSSTGPPLPSGPLSPQRWATIHFISAVIVDTIITGATAWHLHSQKALVARLTSEMISRLIRMVWQSALPPTLCVIANAILVRIHPLHNTHMAVNMVLPKLYAISLMYTLNVRNELRSERGSSYGISMRPLSYPRPSTYHNTPPNLDDSSSVLKQ
ncbi:hypothetical protein CPB86DRAFT_788596 [Serendipita vermifera]|nr:hypothetical protein CPB86DRAFT_788596 [Serendipita vermifera]